MKVCSKCKIEKPKSEFHKRLNRACGVRSQCKECYKKYPKIKKSRKGYSRMYSLHRMYSITIQDYEKLLIEQNNKCAICNSDAEVKTAGVKKHLCVDHCHSTNKVRGLLCDSCNRAIGLLKEDVKTLLKAIDYLTKYSNEKRS